MGFFSLLFQLLAELLLAFWKYEMVKICFIYYNNPLCPNSKCNFPMCSNTVSFHLQTSSIMKELLITWDKWARDGVPETERYLVSFWGLTANVRLRMKTTILHRRQSSEPAFTDCVHWAEHHEGTVTKFYLILPG